MIEKVFDEGLLNFRKLIMKYQQQLNLNAEEILVITKLLSLAEKKRFNLSTNTIARQTSLKMTEAGEIVNSLFEKKLISIEFERKSNNKVGEVFSLRPFFDKITEIFQYEIKKQKESQSLTDIEYSIKSLEKSFSKPLSPTQLEIVRQWYNEDFNKQQIEKAIELTLKHKRKTVQYVDRVLRSDSMFEESSIDEKTAEILRKLVGK